MSYHQSAAYRSGMLGAAPVMRAGPWDSAGKTTAEIIEHSMAVYEAGAAKVLTPDQLASFRPCMASRPRNLSWGDMSKACIDAAKQMPPGSGAPGTVPPTDPGTTPPLEAGMASGTKWMLVGGAVLVLGLGYVLLK